MTAAAKRKQRSNEKDDPNESPIKSKKTTQNSTPTMNHSFDPKTQYKFISWNVNGINACLKRGDHLKDLLAEEKPDVICLQETKLQKSNENKIPSFDGYDVHYNSATSCKGRHGTAVLTKKGGPKVLSIADNLSNHTDGIASEEGRVITVEYEDCYLVSAYVPNSGRKLERLDYRTTEWDRKMEDYLMDLEKKKPVVYTGDLNVSHKDIDIHSPKTNKKTAGFTPQERESFTKMIQKTGLLDSFRELHPDAAGHYTYWSYRFSMRAKDKGWRLDYFMVSSQLKSKIVDSYIMKTTEGS
eukprot:CAMPEP_0117431384 /NCGR_PEP_ID=MMETSP0758-20121206/10904_1 /TAXON_ID=63605 /ORGANISM="Percolomonas cosmopolitus, Strain AE-1 (ATCC 50343)" /LENGTH=297 /DNA_ID=CAMNT_0005220311 /DNA_START=128 /DNA_END=1017 /DNA_ORIENTATION=+